MDSDGLSTRTRLGRVPSAYPQAHNSKSSILRRERSHPGEGVVKPNNVYRRAVYGSKYGPLHPPPVILAEYGVETKWIALYNSCIGYRQATQTSPTHQRDRQSQSSPIPIHWYHPARPHRDITVSTDTNNIFSIRLCNITWDTCDCQKRLNRTNIPSREDRVLDEPAFHFAFQLFSSPHIDGAGSYGAGGQQASIKRVHFVHVLVPKKDEPIHLFSRFHSIGIKVCLTGFTP